MNRNSFDYEKAMQALLYVANELGCPDEHRAFKALYFAERNYLSTYGSTMLGDVFIKMKYGPVPSHVYDLVKATDGRYQGSWISEAGIAYVKESLRVVGSDKNIWPLKPADTTYLAETARNCLDQAITFCRSRSFAELSVLSHDAAWQAATMHKEMNTLQIAAAGGADEVALEYLAESLANDDYHSL